MKHTDDKNSHVERVVLVRVEYHLTNVTLVQVDQTVAGVKLDSARHWSIIRPLAVVTLQGRETVEMVTNVVLVARRRSNTSPAR